MDNHDNSNPADTTNQADIQELEKESSQSKVNTEIYANLLELNLPDQLIEESPQIEKNNQEIEVIQLEHSEKNTHLLQECYEMSKFIAQQGSEESSMMHFIQKEAHAVLQLILEQTEEETERARNSSVANENWARMAQHSVVAEQIETKLDDTSLTMQHNESPSIGDNTYKTPVNQKKMANITNVVNNLQSKNQVFSVERNLGENSENIPVVPVGGETRVEMQGRRKIFKSKLKRKICSDMLNEENKENVQEPKRFRHDVNSLQGLQENKEPESVETKANNEIEMTDEELAFFLCQLKNDNNRTVSSKRHSLLVQTPVLPVTTSTGSGVGLKRAHSLVDYAECDEPRLRLTCENDDSYDIYNVHNQTPDNQKKQKTCTEDDEPKLSDFVLGNNLKPVDEDEDSKCEFEKFVDELGITIVKAVEAPFVERSVESRLDENNNEVAVNESTHDEASANEESILEVQNDERRAKLVFNNVDLLDIEVVEKDDRRATESLYASKVAKVLYSADELASGTFIDPNRKTVSKKTPLNDGRTEILKEAVQLKFEYAPEDREFVWAYVRAEVNKKIATSRSRK